MKVNEAPERIYIPQNDTLESGLEDFWVDHQVFLNEIEYTRTDVFIEKACAWLQENKDKYLYNTGEKGEYIPTCSGKMIEKFRKYMEGE